MKTCFSTRGSLFSRCFRLVVCFGLVAGLGSLILAQEPGGAYTAGDGKTDPPSQKTTSPSKKPAPQVGENQASPTSATRVAQSTVTRLAPNDPLPEPGGAFQVDDGSSEPAENKKSRPAMRTQSQSEARNDSRAAGESPRKSEKKSKTPDDSTDKTGRIIDKSVNENVDKVVKQTGEAINKVFKSILGD